MARQSRIIPFGQVKCKLNCQMFSDSMHDVKHYLHLKSGRLVPEDKTDLLVGLKAT